MSDNGCVAAFGCCIMFTVVCCMSTAYLVKWHWETETVKRGNAEWITSDDGRTTFQWKETITP